MNSDISDVPCPPCQTLAEGHRCDEPRYCACPLPHNEVADLIHAIENADPTLCGACGETYQGGHSCPAIRRGWEQGAAVGAHEVRTAVEAVLDEAPHVNCPETCTCWQRRVRAALTTTHRQLYPTTEETHDQ